MYVLHSDMRYPIYANKAPAMRRRRHREEDIQDEMMRIAETRLLFDPQTTILAYESIN